MKGGEGRECENNSIKGKHEQQQGHINRQRSHKGTVIVEYHTSSGSIDRRKQKTKKQNRQIK